VSGQATRHHGSFSYSWPGSVRMICGEYQIYSRMAGHIPAFSGAKTCHNNKDINILTALSTNLYIDKNKPKYGGLYKKSYFDITDYIVGGCGSG